MAQLDLSVFKEHNRIVALIDGDPKSGHVRKAFIQKCAELQIPVHQLERYALENYFTLNAIQSATHSEVPSNLAILAPDSKVADQLGFEVKKNGRAIARLMQISDIDGTDLQKFLDQIEGTLKSG